jgi:perosamine synthetase
MILENISMRINLFEPYIDKNAWRRVKETLSSGFINEGKNCELLKDKLKEFGLFKTNLVNSGTSSLHLALLLAGVKYGDEVILPAQTFIATGLVILHCGATPVFADIDKRGIISVEDVGKKITKKTKAIIGVDWGGLPICIKGLQQYGLPVIEDAAHSLGAMYGDKYVGNIADYTCFSFQTIKNLSMGDGGAICCKDAKKHRLATRMKWFGLSKTAKRDREGERKTNVNIIGYKYNMNDFTATLGLSNIISLKERIIRRKEIAAIYNKELNIKHTLNSSFWLYPIFVENRVKFVSYMKDKGIEVSVVDRRIDRHRIFGGMKNLPMTKWFDEHQVNIPVHENLTDKDIQYVISSIKSYEGFASR